MPSDSGSSKKASAKKKRKSLKRQRASSAGDEGAMGSTVAAAGAITGTPASVGLARAMAALDYVRGAPTSVVTIMAAADLLHRLRQRFATADGKLNKYTGQILNRINTLQMVVDSRNETSHAKPDEYGNHYDNPQPSRRRCARIPRGRRRRIIYHRTIKVPFDGGVCPAAIAKPSLPKPLASSAHPSLPQRPPTAFGGLAETHERWQRWWWR